MHSAAHRCSWLSNQNLDGVSSRLCEISLISLIKDSLSRRGIVGAVSAFGAGLWSGLSSHTSKAAEPAKDLTSQMSLVKREHPRALWTRKPAIIKASPPFDLDDPIGNWHAVMKVATSLVGSRTYVSSYQRNFICPVGKSPMPFFAGCGAWTHQLVEAPSELLKGVPPGTLMQLALYTGVVLDPWTFKPVKQVLNPYTGKMVEVEDSVYAESYLVYPGGGMTSLERPEALDDRTARPQPYLRSGKKISFNLAALFSGDGPHQPRMDASWWTVNYDDLMNPSVADVDADYSWAGLHHARDKKWWGVDQSDGAQMLANVHGTVAKHPSRIEPIVQEYVFSKYPERM